MFYRIEYLCSFPTTLLGAGFKRAEVRATEPTSDRRIEVINQAQNNKEDLIQDFVSIITSFCARLYSQ
ncbi:MAG: hypothetical protein DPW09_44015 [Anaerolineae bacterium]|nr:hypothetical protein [Anaerolineae bacterium]